MNCACGEPSWEGAPPDGAARPHTPGGTNAAAVVGAPTIAVVGTCPNGAAACTGITQRIGVHRRFDGPNDNSWEAEQTLHPELVADFKRDFPQQVKVRPRCPAAIRKVRLRCALPGRCRMGLRGSEAG